MGPQGKMVGLQAGWLSYWLALGCLTVTTILFIKLAYQGWQSVQAARNYPPLNLDGRQARLLNTGALFAAQIGFWQPELVLSQGLLQALDPAHLESVLAHEQGHYYYRDTFWFFWLGWVRECTAWLPNTDALWQELLVLRELRADAHAALQVDPLLLAESLLLVVSSESVSSEILCAALGSASSGERLEERIDALLAQPEMMPKPKLQSWSWFLFAFLPLVTVLFHS
jgi:Zn-dependent protease with chaperone function